MPMMFDEISFVVGEITHISFFFLKQGEPRQFRLLIYKPNSLLQYIYHTL